MGERNKDIKRMKAIVEEMVQQIATLSARLAVVEENSMVILAKYYGLVATLEPNDKIASAAFKQQVQQGAEEAEVLLRRQIAKEEAKIKAQAKPKPKASGVLQFQRKHEA